MAWSPAWSWLCLILARAEREGEEAIKTAQHTQAAENSGFWPPSSRFAWCQAIREKKRKVGRGARKALHGISKSALVFLAVASSSSQVVFCAPSHTYLSTTGVLALGPYPRGRGRGDQREKIDAEKTTLCTTARVRENNGRWWWVNDTELCATSRLSSFPNGENIPSIHPSSVRLARPKNKNKNKKPPSISLCPPPPLTSSRTESPVPAAQSNEMISFA